MYEPPPSLPPIKLFGLTLNGLTDWLNKLRDFSASCRPLDSRNIRISRTTSGTRFEGTAENKTASSDLQAYVLQEVHDDILYCTPLITQAVPDLPSFTPADPSTLVTIAKPFELRQTAWEVASLQPGGINGIKYTFPVFLTPTRNDSTNRRATLLSDNTQETQRIVPYYVPGWSIIYAQKVTGLLHYTQLRIDHSDPSVIPPGPSTFVTSCDLLDTNNGGRAWARAS